MTSSSLRIDPDLMRIARDRAEVMAANDVMSHTEPNGQKVFDRIRAAGLTWYGAGEIIAWNNYPMEYSPAEAISAWMASPGHKAIMISTGYNYVGYGAAESASGKLYYAGVFIKEPDETGAWAKFRTISKQRVFRREAFGSRSAGTGADTRLQVLTAGLRYFEVQRRRVGGDVALLGNDDRDLAKRHLVARIRPRGPSPGPRQGRQLGRLADPPHRPLIGPRLPQRSLIARAGARRTWNGAGT